MSEELLSIFENLSVNESNAMNADDLQQIIAAAVNQALAQQSQQFEERLRAAEDRAAVPTVPQVTAYSPIDITNNVKCEIGLDVVKTLPIFAGERKNYVSWRQAAQNAYKIFESYNGTSRHFEAVCIIRNKITGSADANLTSFSTPLNFEAIIARLDNTYADKRPLYLIEQELSTLRQGNLTVNEYYDEVEKILTLLTNKSIMTFDKTIASAINEKYRQDGLRVFISGLKRSLSDTLFASRPVDLPSALAMAEELESNRVRFQFASSFVKYSETKETDHKFLNTASAQRENKVYPNYAQRENKISPNYIPKHKQPAEPMDIDPSVSRIRSNVFNKSKSGFDPQSLRQNVNNLIGEDYEERSNEEVRQMAHEIEDQDLNFLEVGPCFHT